MAGSSGCLAEIYEEVLNAFRTMRVAPDKGNLSSRQRQQETGSDDGQRRRSRNRVRRPKFQHRRG